MTKTPIRTIVVDDEPVARARVRSLLEDEDDIVVVGECSNARQASAAIERLSPDLLFLDIQMGERSGLDLARSLGPNRPAIVFVTAYDEYALPAFEIRALDYLMKPFSAARFHSALSHAREHIALHRAGALGQEVMALLPGAERQRPARDRLVIKSSGRIYFVPTAKIDWCEAAGNYVRLHVGAQTHLIRETMSHLESELDSARFARIHRSTIVSVDRIKEIRSSFNGEHVVTLEDGTRLTLSRGYRDLMQTRFGSAF